MKVLSHVPARLALVATLSMQASFVSAQQYVDPQPYEDRLMSLELDLCTELALAQDEQNAYAEFVSLVSEADTLWERYLEAKDKVHYHWYFIWYFGYNSTLPAPADNWHVHPEYYDDYMIAKGEQPEGEMRNNDLTYAMSSVTDFASTAAMYVGSVGSQEVNDPFTAEYLQATTTALDNYETAIGQITRYRGNLNYWANKNNPTWMNLLSGAIAEMKRKIYQYEAFYDHNLEGH